MITDPSIYDAMIAEAMRRFVPMRDWRWGKAQLFQESRLNPIAHNARSGADGIAQFMRPTWDDMLASVPGIPRHATPFDVTWAIPAYAFYMSKLNSWWKTDRSADEKWRLAVASYNCGFGNMLKAQQLAGGARDYHLIIERLHEVTGDANASETRNYVMRIEGYYSQLTVFGSGA